MSTDMKALADEGEKLVACHAVDMDIAGAYRFIKKVVASLQQSAAPGEPVAMLGGINGVSLMRHIKAMQPKAQSAYHTPLYKHPPSDERAKVVEECCQLITELTLKHGTATGTDYQQGAMDHGYRLLHKVRALSPSTALTESELRQARENLLGSEGVVLSADSKMDRW